MEGCYRFFLRLDGPQEIRASEAVDNFPNYSLFINLFLFISLLSIYLFTSLHIRRLINSHKTKLLVEYYKSEKKSKKD